MLSLFKKGYRELKNNGPFILFKKAIKYLSKKLHSKKLKKEQQFKDILFINGCSLSHPFRYRVEHQIEQLKFNGISCDDIYYTHLKIGFLKYYRGFVFFRCPHTDLIEEFIINAKANNKTVFFDIDDLVIDKKYTNEIKYLKKLSPYDLSLYDDGVIGMQKTLRLSDYAITTTEALATELQNYVPEVFINRNVASEKMVKLSLEAIRTIKRDKERFIAGYFSGSITHNDDFNLIIPVLVRLFKKYPNFYLSIVGLLDLPECLKEYKSRILTTKFSDWERLPQMIASVNVNLAPLENNIFNQAKSENKWVEAALVKVPTVASSIGAFKQKIEDNITGILCSNENEWYNALTRLMQDKKYYQDIAENAHQYVIENCVTAYSGYPLAKFITEKLSPNIAFVLPSTQTSGGINVIIKHCHILKQNGYDVLLITESIDSNNFVNSDGEIFVLKDNTNFIGHIDKGVATLWSTQEFLKSITNIKKRYYLVQNFETDFYGFTDKNKILANSTYNCYSEINYITISKWCVDWLNNKFEKECKYAPNGIDISRFLMEERDYTGKIRILIEGNSADYYKNVDESFEIANQLDRNKYEVWYLSYLDKPKSWYKVDKFLHKVPYDRVGEIYRSCHILIKSSKLESFSYPPLEMMSTGGIVIIAPNCGNIEYIKDHQNCLTYENGNIQKALSLIDEVTKDESLRNTLIENGIKTAELRDWNIISQKIIDLYQ